MGGGAVSSSLRLGERGPQPAEMAIVCLLPKAVPSNVNKDTPPSETPLTFPLSNSATLAPTLMKPQAEVLMLTGRASHSLPSSASSGPDTLPTSLQKLPDTLGEVGRPHVPTPLLGPPRGGLHLHSPGPVEGSHWQCLRRRAGVARGHGLAHIPQICVL